MAWVVAGSALGPYVFNLCFDLFGGYRGAAVLTAGLVLVLLVGVPFANRPQAPEA
jgi:cyanate permease